MVAMGERKGELVSLTNMGVRTRLEFLIPSRGLFGYKSQFLTDTRGEGVMSSIFEEYAPFKGHIDRRNYGALVAYEKFLSIEPDEKELTEEIQKKVIDLGAKYY